MQHVTVTEYDPRWEKLFEEEKRLIASILGITPQKYIT